MQASFETLSLDNDWIKKLNAMKIVTPTPIQAEAIPAILEGHDLIARSQTGTGKTLAYVLPVLETIDRSSKRLQAVILTPTRELGMQVLEVIESLVPDTGIIAQPLIGGASIQRQVDKLKLHPQIVVGTPGRVLELIKLKKLSMHYVRTIVVDEADEVFRLGERNEAEAIIKSALRERQLVFFTATVSNELRDWAERLMKAPITRLSVDPDQMAPSSIEHIYFISEERDKIDTLRRLVRLYHPKSAIVFINDTDKVGEVAAKLQYVGLSVEALYGDSGKQERARTIKRFREGKFQLLLATDVASRGLDFPEVSHVFNLQLPVDPDHYVHRAGRTGRMGRRGTVVSLAEVGELFIIEKFSKAIGTPIVHKDMYEGVIIDPADKRGRRAGRMKEQAVISSVTPQADKEQFKKRTGTLKRIQDSSTNSPAPGSSAKKAKTSRLRDRKNKGAPKWLKNKKQ
ncbi:DEAD-box ATP-dependent RNA helicase CshA [Chlamydia abortus]|uniref:DEAD/DEAH box helicase n=1 Tax=Paenibacillus residui TaxID=629724 RepID=A0ABW3DFG1_9BACL|nr:DEAD/DEAH box helicase [Aneurinibacillus sp. XH2]SHE12451.1 DEAD-box ATP-dependent RNA helicase CshA [Chlamydia abortus]